MKKVYWIVGSIFVGVFLLFAIVNIVNTEYQSEGQKKIAATIFPIADIAKNIAGNEYEVITILPSGASPHTFEVTPSDVKNLQGSSTVLSIGNGLDTWVQDITTSIPEAEVITIDTGIELLEFSEEHTHSHDHEEAHADEDEQVHEHEDETHAHEDDEESHEENHADEHDHEHGEYDPHYWLSFTNAEIIAQNIANVLIELDVDNKEVYKNNLSEYKKELQTAKKEAQETLVDFDEEIIVFHDSWSYFAKEFTIEIVGVFAESPGKEPTPQYFAELEEYANENGVKYIFSEPQLSPETLEPFVNDLGLTFSVLDPLGGVEGRMSYIELMQYNAQTLYEATKKEY